jgi:hypothetical protein
MNRRTLAAGLAALAGATPTLALAHDATPADLGETPATKVLSRYLTEVVAGGNVELIDEFFDAQWFDIEQLYWQHVEAQAEVRSAGGTISIDTELVFGTAHYAAAMVYLTQRVGDTHSQTEHLYIVTVEGGVFVYFHTASGPSTLPQVSP